MVALLIPTIAAFAQSGTVDQTASSQDNEGLQEIVVTAQRRAQSILSVPMSIQAVTGDQLLNTGLTEVRDLAYTTPGLTVDYSAGYSQIYIRGVGNAIFVGADPSVATFIDDVPRIYGSLVQNFVDVDRVEVLKGAQGGLYGRNATGGVVNIITRQPNTDTLEGNALVDYGEKNTFRAAAFVNVPMGDKLAAHSSAGLVSLQGRFERSCSNPADSGQCQVRDRAAHAASDLAAKQIT